MSHSIKNHIKRRGSIFSQGVNLIAARQDLIRHKTFGKRDRFIKNRKLGIFSIS